MLIGVTGIWTALRAAKYGSTAVPPGFSEPTFSIVPLGDIVLFALFFGGAVYCRKDPATHKRLILIASFPVRIALMSRPAWTAFSTWLATLV